jgi:hypothetical protein
MHEIPACVCSILGDHFGTAWHIFSISRPNLQHLGIASTGTNQSTLLRHLANIMIGFFAKNQEGSEMTRNAIRLAWLLLGLAILSAVATLPALAQVSQSAAAGSSNAQEPQPPAGADAPNALNILPVAPHSMVPRGKMQT